MTSTTPCTFCIENHVVWACGAARSSRLHSHSPTITTHFSRQDSSHTMNCTDEQQCHGQGQEEQREQQKQLEKSSSFSTLSSQSSVNDSEEELQHMSLAPPRLKSYKHLSKQLSMCETPRDIAWEKRRRQILRQERRKRGIPDSEDLTDEDLSELKGCIELGFGFNEEDGQRLCGTLPALDLYFAVNRQLSPSPVSTPQSRHSTSSPLGARSSSFGSPMSDSDNWKICSPGNIYI